MTTAPEPPISQEDEGGASTPEWRDRLRAITERTVRQRVARSEQRQALSARRNAGMQLRKAVRLARINDDLR